MLNLSCKLSTLVFSVIPTDLIQRKIPTKTIIIVKQFLKINPADNVVVAIQPLTKGTVIDVDGEQITLVTNIPAGHKCALKDFAEGENIIKYGFPIGHARHAIQKGSYLDHEDIKTNLAGTLDYSNIHIKGLKKYEPSGEQLTFQGYVRPDGQVGIRNEVWVIPTVGCVNGIIKQIVEKTRAAFGGDKIEGIDGIFNFPHNFGCSPRGRSGLREQPAPHLRGVLRRLQQGSCEVHDLPGGTGR